MPRRLLAILGALFVLAGCGTAGTGVTVPPEQAAPSISAHRVDEATAEQAFQLLDRLDKALSQHDCAAVDDLVTWAARTLGGRACEATRNGRPARYGDPEFLLPDADDWFAALARKPSPAYFVFVLEDNRWRLGAGPIPVIGRPPAHTPGATADPDLAVEAGLVPQRHLTFLTDPAGVQGVRFPAGDPLQGLRAGIADVEFVDGGARAVALSSTQLLVFDALRIRRTAGRTETVELASVVTAGNRCATVGLLRR
ncbi:hypothetical protein [Nonomuraea sediminis]|uniref:hypothetical protein n=1 Tax=Nonomuraea sediminis TaxID=2835864 RepID=UPI001BDD8B0C|nr:hypothetical protein [Nonomuraea sediminis]